MANRETRKCSSCNVSDTHAHHIQYVAFIHPITKESTDISVSKHIQCCANDGCEICITDMEFAPNKSIGESFTNYMQTKSPEHLSVLADRHGIDTNKEV